MDIKQINPDDIGGNYQLALATVAMPENTNANGDIFGGWVMSQMDLSGSVLARRLANDRVVTVAANNIQFKSPIKVGELVSSFGKIDKIGTSSIYIEVVVTADSLHKNKPRVVAIGNFVYVSIDQIGNPQAIKK